MCVCVGGGGGGGEGYLPLATLKRTSIANAQVLFWSQAIRISEGLNYTFATIPEDFYCCVFIIFYSGDGTSDNQYNVKLIFLCS